jgi:ornithine cyclodeaminase/alanine dehydrogenase
MTRNAETLLYLTRADVARLLPPITEQIDLVERTYRALAAGRVELPPKPGIHPRKDAFIHAMPSYLRDEDVASLKWIAGYPENPQRGLPYINGLIVLNDSETGVPICVMDGAEITAARTAAASGVCVRRFAPSGWTDAAILGCGEQGRAHARVLGELNSAARIRAFDVLPERTASLEGDVTRCSDPREAVAGAEIVVSAGPIAEDPQPPISASWLAERWLALPLDFDFYFQAEAIEAAELFVVDDVGQFEHYRELGHFRSWPAPSGSVGSALDTSGESARIACVNLGIGALDAAFAKHVLDAALARDVGARLSR